MSYSGLLNDQDLFVEIRDEKDYTILNVKCLSVLALNGLHKFMLLLDEPVQLPSFVEGYQLALNKNR